MWIIQTTTPRESGRDYFIVRSGSWGDLSKATKFENEVDARAYQFEFGLQRITEVRNIGAEA